MSVELNGQVKVQTVEECDDRVVSVGASIQDGPEAKILQVESCYGKGFAGIQIIGNTGQIVDDGKERARMALERLGYVMPPRRLMISVSPGDIKVEGSHLDLAFAVAIAAQIIQDTPVMNLEKWVFAAEVALDGELRPVPGSICHGVAAMAGHMEGVVVAEENLPELRALGAISSRSGKKIVYRSFKDVAGVLAWLWGGDSSQVTSDESPLDYLPEVAESNPRSFDDMELSDELRLAAMVTAAGMHSLLLRGVPGCGKSMFAERLVSLLPQLQPDDHLAVLQTHSSHPSPLEASILSGRPPFRSPHHLASSAAMLGAANRPGEVALASHGVLFLDEFPEFRRDVIEALRQPLESGEVQVSRAQTKRVWRAKIMLVAAANNCPCGWRGSSQRRCICPESRVSAYLNRISGPILDRIDVHLNLPERGSDLSGIFRKTPSCGEGLSTREMQDSVQKAQDRAVNRNQAFGVRLNRDLPARALAEVLRWDSVELDLYLKELLPSHASLRSTIRCLRVARTIADVLQQDKVSEVDLQTAWGWQSYSAALRRGDFKDTLKHVHGIKGITNSRNSAYLVVKEGDGPLRV